MRKIKEPTSFYKVINNGKNLHDFIEDGAISYTLEDTKFTLFYNGDIVDTTVLYEGEALEICVRDEQTPTILPCPAVKENVGTMLPIVGLNGPVIKKQNQDEEKDDMEFKFDKPLIDYIENPEIPYDSNIFEGVEDSVLNYKTDVDVNRDIRKTILKTRTLEAKISNSKDIDSNKLIDMKRELVANKKKLSSFKKGASQSLLKEINKLDKLAYKEAKKYIKNEDKNVSESVEENINEKFSITDDGRLNYWSQMLAGTEEKLKKTNDPKEKEKLAKKIAEYKYKIDEIKTSQSDKETGRQKGVGFHGKMHTSRLVTASTNDTIEELTDKLNYATEKFNETGDIRYEKMIKGLNNIISFKSNDNSIIYNTVTESVNDAYEEAANMEDEIKPIVAELERKGYQVKYASPGHKKLRKKEDKEPDGVFYGKLYSDARIMFDKKYDFPEAPKEWKWRLVDGCSYLDVNERSYSDNSITPDEAFNEWKKDYMNSLREFVKNLKPLKEEKEFNESVNTNMNNFESIIQEIKNKGYIVTSYSIGSMKVIKKPNLSKDSKDIGFNGKMKTNGKIVFGKKYDFNNIPNQWESNIVNGHTVLSTTEIEYNDNVDSLDNIFDDVQKCYIEELKKFVKNLKPLKEEKEVKESSTVDFDTLYDDIFNDIL